VKPKYSIIIPTKNEENGIAKVINSIPKDIRKFSEVIVVDSSSDRTPTIARELGTKVIKEKRSGKGLAMRTGVRNARGNILVFLDGDGTYPSSYIKKMIKKLKSADLVLGCRKTDDIILKIGIFLEKLLFSLVNFNVPDPLTGYRVTRKKDWHRLALKSKGFEIETEMNIEAIEKNFRIKYLIFPHSYGLRDFFKSKFVRDLRARYNAYKIVIVKYRNSKLN